MIFVFVGFVIVVIDWWICIGIVGRVFIYVIMIFIGLVIDGVEFVNNWLVGIWGEGNEKILVYIKFVCVYVC